MPITQLGLKATLHDLKMICRQQFFLAQTIHGFNHPAIEAAIFDAKNTFREFDRMEVWLTPFDFDMLQLLQIMMQIDQVQVIHLDNFTDAITALTDFLQNEVLEPPVLAASVEMDEPEIAAAVVVGEAETSRSIDPPVAAADSEPAVIVPTDSNLLVLDKLRLNQQKIRNKQRVFKNQGEDLVNNVEFKTAKANLRPEVKLYRECLKTNQVHSASTDVLVFENIGRIIKENVSTVPNFIQVLENYTTTIISKLPPAEEPIADNDTDPTEPTDSEDDNV